MECTTIFVFSNMMYLSAITAFSISKPFRKPFYTNLWFTFNFFGLYLYNFLIIFFPWTRLPGFEFNESITSEWLFEVSLIGLISNLIIYLFEKLICNSLFLYFSSKKVIDDHSLNLTFL